MDRPIPQTGEFWLLKNQHLAMIVACPVEMVQNGTLCCVYMDYNNPNRLMANELEAFMESAHRLYDHKLKDWL